MSQSSETIEQQVSTGARLSWCPPSWLQRWTFLFGLPSITQGLPCRTQCPQVREADPPRTTEVSGGHVDSTRLGLSERLTERVQGTQARQ